MLLARREDTFVLGVEVPEVDLPPAGITTIKTSSVVMFQVAELVAIAAVRLATHDVQPCLGPLLSLGARRRADGWRGAWPCGDDRVG